jgi:hypothetical protein
METKVSAGLAARRHSTSERLYYAYQNCVRTTGAVMSGKDHDNRARPPKQTKRTREKESRHVRLYHWFLKSDAWKSLSPNALALSKATGDPFVSQYQTNLSDGGRTGGCRACRHSSAVQKFRSFALTQRPSSAIR